MKLFNKTEAAPVSKAAKVMDFVRGFAEISEAILDMQAEADRQKARGDDLCDKLMASEADRLQAYFQIGDLKKRITRLEAALAQECALSADISAAMQRHKGAQQ